jgi:SAM-dependent methyltransferase
MREVRTRSPVQSAAELGLPSTNLAKLRARYRDNGARWLAFHVLDHTASRVSRFFERKTRELEISADLPGVNSRRDNRTQWSNYDWSLGGEEWTASAEWRRSLIDEVMLPNMPADPVSLEIGPGAGRWSSELLAASRRLVLADISEQALKLCRQKLGEDKNLEYHVTDGASLGAVAASSIDFVWSFDVFVHIAPVDQKSYLRELARVMRPGAYAVIHHAGDAGMAGPRAAWRSSMTAELFTRLVSDSGMRLVHQFERWGPNLQFTVSTAGDVITVFSR